MNFPDKLVALIQSKGISQAKLASQTGLSQSAISEMTLSKRRPYMDQAFALARALGVTVDYLADESATVPVVSSKAFDQEAFLSEPMRIGGTEGLLMRLYHRGVVDKLVGLQNLITSKLDEPIAIDVTKSLNMLLVMSRGFLHRLEAMQSERKASRMQFWLLALDYIGFSNVFAATLHQLESELLTTKIFAEFQERSFTLNTENMRLVEIYTNAMRRSTGLDYGPSIPPPSDSTTASDDDPPSAAGDKPTS